MASNMISQTVSKMGTARARTSSIISAAASLAATTVLIRSIANDLFPHHLRYHLSSSLSALLGRYSSDFSITIEEFEGLTVNQLFLSAEVYLGAISFSTTRSVRAGKSEKEKSITLSANQGQEIVDVFDGIRLRWVYVCHETSNSTRFSENDDDRTVLISHERYYHLIFHSSHKHTVITSYLPHVMERAKEMKQAMKGLKLHMLKRESYHSRGSGIWTSVSFDHPATFETLAMDPEVKNSLIEDLERFVGGKEYYRRVGKAWKRGYLLYGPPGTGKSSLIAAIANFLSYNVYDLELADLKSNSDLKRLLLSTSNRSIIVVEDIDCSIDLSRQDGVAGADWKSGKSNQDYRVTLSGLLNFIDGLWSSCGDERVIIFTTNHREKLDPALLRPGRMDMHIHMSYCSSSGFRTLAKNYLEVTDHHLLEEIDGLMEEFELTPAEVAEELMKSRDPDTALQMFIQFLQDQKKMTIPTDQC